MTADALKSVSITKLDTTPLPVRGTAGEYGSGTLRVQTDYVLPTTGGLGDTGSKYKMARVRSNVKLKSLVLQVDGVLDSSTGFTTNGVSMRDANIRSNDFVSGYVLRAPWASG